MAEWIIEIKDGKYPIGKWTELVRCKDCKHAKTAQTVLSGIISWCDVWSGKYYHSEGNDPIEPNDYCSYGERREE